MGILLTPEEREQYEVLSCEYGEEWDIDGLNKAQALKVLDEMEKPCPHVHKILPNRPKRACDTCMAEIRKE